MQYGTGFGDQMALGKKSEGGEIEQFDTGLQRIDETTFRGHAFWRQRPSVRVVVEVMIDDEPVCLVRAEQHEPRLLAAGFGDGCYGLTFVVDRRQLKGHRTLRARIANTETAVGWPIDLVLDAFSAEPSPSAGEVQWQGGLRLAGSIFGSSQENGRPIVNIFEGGTLVAEVRGRRWAPGQHNVKDACAHHFDAHLPAGFADGRPHVLSVTNAQGLELDGSPVTIQAFNDGLRQYLQGTSFLATDEARAKWFDRFLPMSFPFEEYAEWKRRFVLPDGCQANNSSVRVFLIGDRGAEAGIARLRHQTHRNWSVVAVPSVDEIEFRWDDFRETLTADRNEFEICLFLNAGTILRNDALAVLSDAIAGTDALVAYCDIEIADSNGSSRPMFFPAFDYDRSLEQGYASHCFAIKASELSIPGAEEVGSLARLFLAQFDKAGTNSRRRVLHVPGVLAQVEAVDLAAAGRALESATANHMRSRGIAVDITRVASTTFPAFRVKRKQISNETVSIVIPTRDKADLLSTCIESIRHGTKGVKYEIVIVDNGSAEKKALEYLEKARNEGVSVINAPGQFNYSRLNNRGVAATRGSLVCLLNNDTEIQDAEWLEEMLSRILEPDVGAVAPMLLWPNNMIQHGGIVLGPNFAASDAFNDCMLGDPGHSDLLHVAHESSAVTAACLLVRREDYLALAGFDETAFPVLFNDVDFCLRLRASGKRIIFTPHTRLIHHESLSRIRDISYDRSSRFRRELTHLRNRWGSVLADDPAYSPFLNLDPYPFSALAWPPRSAKPRWNRPIVAP